MRCCLIVISIFVMMGCSTFLHNNNHYRQQSAISAKGQSDFDYLLTEALKQKVLGNYSQTKYFLLKCLAIKPKSAVVNYELSVIFESIGDIGSAISFGRNALKNDKKNEWYLLQCARLYQSLGNTDSVIIFYNAIVKLRPEKYDYCFKLAQLYYQKKEFKESLKILNNLESETGPSVDIYFAEYKNYLLLNENNSCLTILNNAIKMFPEETRFYGLLAEHYASIGNKELALKSYTELLNLDSENERGYLSLIDFYRNSGQIKESFDLASKFINNTSFTAPHKIELISSYLGDKESIHKNALEIKALIDSFVCGNTEDIQGLILRADFYLKSNDLKNARADLEFLLTETKDNVLIWEQLLFVLISMNDFNAVFKLTDDAISTFTDNPLFYLYKGISSYQLKRYKDGIFVLEKGLRFADGSKDLLSKYYSYLGEAYHAIKENESSDFYFLKALQIDPKNVIVLNNFSYYLSLRSEKLDSATKFMERCLKIEPNNSTFLDTYGWVLFKAGRTVEAKSVIEDALKLGGSSNSNILEHYCEILIRLNMLDEAKDYYKKIIILGKESQRIKELLNTSN